MFNDKTSVNTIDINFGPQHPAAHGVLRLLLRLKNERIVDCDAHIGLLHRGTEDLIETKPYYLSVPYFDRLDYVSTLNQEHAYCLAVESALNVEITPGPVGLTRTMLDESTRILNHLLAIACHALDVGSMSPLFWLFEERENLMCVYEKLSGARMHTAYYRPMSHQAQPDSCNLDYLGTVVSSILTSVNEANSVLLNNKVWKTRLVGIGLVSPKHVQTFGLSGVMARSAGCAYDLRTGDSSYAYYPYIQFNSFVSLNGDSYDRYLLRIYEISEAVSIVVKCLWRSRVLLNKTTELVSSVTMESTISKFKVWSGTSPLKPSIVPAYVESPKGQFGVVLTTNGSPVPERCKIRSPSYNHLFWLTAAAKGLLLGDLITLIGTVDIVFGEIDR